MSVWVKTHNPGDEGKNTFRLEIGIDDGSEPNPREVLAYLIWVGLDVAKESEIADPREFFHEMVDADVLLKKEIMS